MLSWSSRVGVFLGLFGILIAFPQTAVAEGFHSDLVAHSKQAPRLLQKWHPETTAWLKKRLPSHPFVISSEEVKKLTQELNISTDQLMVELIPIAQAYARPEVSHYQVGAVGRIKKSGELILGVNLEFAGFPLNFTVHGEQFVVTRALSLGAGPLESLALSADPCGHCRQWLNELQKGGYVRILVPNEKARRLKSRLPNAFGPADLKVTAGLLAEKAPSGLENSGISGEQAAIRASERSYAPYTQAPSGVSLKMKGGHLIVGPYIENAAFNPSLSPLLAALVNLVAEGGEYSDIKEAYLAERTDGASPISQKPLIEPLLKKLAPKAPLAIVSLPQKKKD